MLYLYAILLAFLMPLSAQADIFLKQDDGQKRATSQNRPIFVNPFSKGTETRQAPQYPILNQNTNQRPSSQGVTYDNSAQRLQAQKLREARAQKYKRQRQQSINILTLADDMAARNGGNLEISDLLDTTAYDAALAARANEKTVTARQIQAQNEAEREAARQEIEKLGQQAARDADLIEQRMNQNGQVRDPRGNPNRIYTP